MSNNNGVTEQNSQVKNGLYNGMPPSSKQGMTPSQLIMVISCLLPFQCLTSSQTLQWTYGFNQNRASTVKYIGAVKEQRVRFILRFIYNDFDCITRKTSF